MGFSEWEDAKLGDYVTIKHGYAFSREQFSEECLGRPIIVNIGNFDYSGGFRFEKTKVRECATDYPKEYVLKPGEILLAMTCQTAGGEILGIPGKIPDDGRLYLHNQRLGKIEIRKSSKVALDFIYYMCLWSVFRNELFVTATGTKILHTAPKRIENFKCKFPPIKEQKAIASILSTLDDKIELNNQINKNLEEMAQAIFKRWFVDFEFPCLPENYKFSGAGKPEDLERACTYKRVGGLPVPDGESWFVYVLLCNDGSFYKGITTDLYRRFYEHYIGKGAKHTKTHRPIKVIHHERFNSQEKARKREEELKTGYGREWLKREYDKYLSGGSLASQTRLKVAGEMVESELGLIPKGWEVGAIEDIADVVGGGTPSKKREDFFTNQGIPWLTPKDLSETKDKKFICRGKLDITELGLKNSSAKLMPKGTVLFSSRAPIGYIAIAKNDITTNQGFKSLVPKKDINSEYIYYMLKLITPAIESRASGSTFKEISGGLMKKTEIMVPNKDVINKFGEIINSISLQILKNEEEIEILTETRDTLLPKLMSGEIRVPIEE